jgi:hypothetical protein
VSTNSSQLGPGTGLNSSPRIGENGEVTRRRRTRADLLLTATDPKAVPDLVERFTRARLLTQGVEREEGTVEVTHEALLRAWPRLRTDRG